FLSPREMDEAASPADVIDAVEEAYKLYEEKAFSQPERVHADANGGTLLLMPCFTKEAFGTKVISLFPDNPQKNLPVLNGLMILNEGSTGQPLALLDGSALTARRTAAAGALSIRHMTMDTVRSIGVVGAGIQGLHQALFACEVRPVSEFQVYDISEKRMIDFERQLADYRPELKINRCGSAAELVERSQVVITTTTSRSPVLPDNAALLKWRHYVGIGSYQADVREFPPALFSVIDEVFIDTDHALRESGDIIQPLDEGLIKRENIHTFGKLVIGDIPSDPLREKTTFFKSVGMALFDLMAASIIYHRAKEKGLGTPLSL
ncbi:MAG: ornithine cyclodeaminase family protein, partial [Candidatus Aminicenantes bacterium]|nr:ornithine cyclodeaminase family protein [Candidatus Aminicenantes bacterium]